MIRRISSMSRLADELLEHKKTLNTEVQKTGSNLNTVYLRKAKTKYKNYDKGSEKNGDVVLYEHFLNFHRNNKIDKYVNKLQRVNRLSPTGINVVHIRDIPHNLVISYNKNGYEYVDPNKLYNFLESKILSPITESNILFKIYLEIQYVLMQADKYLLRSMGIPKNVNVLKLPYMSIDMFLEFIKSSFGISNIIKKSDKFFSFSFTGEYDEINESELYIIYSVSEIIKEYFRLYSNNIDCGTTYSRIVNNNNTKNLSLNNNDLLYQTQNTEYYLSSDTFYKIIYQTRKLRLDYIEYNKILKNVNIENGNIGMDSKFYDENKEEIDNIIQNVENENCLEEVNNTEPTNKKVLDYTIDKVEPIKKVIQY